MTELYSFLHHSVIFAKIFTSSSNIVTTFSFTLKFCKIFLSHTRVQLKEIKTFFKNKITEKMYVYSIIKYYIYLLFNLQFYRKFLLHTLEFKEIKNFFLEKRNLKNAYVLFYQILYSFVYLTQSFTENFFCMH